jgi:hypothetical protein
VSGVASAGPQAKVAQRDQIAAAPAGETDDGEARPRASGAVKIQPAHHLSPLHDPGGLRSRFGNAHTIIDDLRN